MLLVFALLVPSAARASSRPVEVHQWLALPQPETRIAALTLDADGLASGLKRCSRGAFAS